MVIEVRCLANILKHNRSLIDKTGGESAHRLVRDYGYKYGDNIEFHMLGDEGTYDIPKTAIATYAFLLRLCQDEAKLKLPMFDLAVSESERSDIIRGLLVPHVMGL